MSKSQLGAVWVRLWLGGYSAVPERVRDLPKVTQLRVAHSPEPGQLLPQQKADPSPSKVNISPKSPQNKLNYKTEVIWLD